MGNHDQGQRRPKSISDAEQIFITAIAKRILADGKSTITFSDIKDSLPYGAGEDRRNAAMEENLTESAADGLLPANHKTMRD
jgi:hypothetical protein